MGERPSTALLSRHIHAMNDHFNQLYWEATTNRQCREICRAALVNLAAWLGWLRAGETFSLRWEDVTMTEPRDGPTLGLPAHTGAARLCLSEQTKSDRTQTADVVLAYTSASGLSIGLWYHRLRRACGGSPPPTEHVFKHEEGAIWTSHYFRTTYLYPLLHILRSSGDPFLSAFDGSPGNSLAFVLTRRKNARLLLASRLLAQS
jgi:integrase